VWGWLGLVLLAGSWVDFCVRLLEIVWVGWGGACGFCVGVEDCGVGVVIRVFGGCLWGVISFGLGMFCGAAVIVGCFVLVWVWILFLGMVFNSCAWRRVCSVGFGR